MSELVLILPVASAGARAALASPLARARESRLAAGDWRTWLAQRLGVEALAQRPPAQVAAAAVGVAAEGAWFATPVALVAALDHVRMHATGWLTLTEGEACELAARFASVFEGSGLALSPAGAEGFLLSGLAADPVRTHDPAHLLAADIGPWLAAGEGAAALRRLGTEIEMWLHEHPVNRARARRGVAPVSTLWLWGGGESLCVATQTAAPRKPARAGLPRAYGSDSWLRGLWQAAGRPIDGDAEALAQVQMTPHADTVVVARCGVDEDVAGRWCDPALAHLAARRIKAVQLVIDDRLFRFSRFDLVKPWRRTVSWAAPA
ncbi:MAG TPA: hypothetical protein PLC64_03190 [Steroidobacteraceae bacterium]|mgnify:CR=1 FL=1|nr:hypothetical protein [Steroidobacteraceae bacterium]HQW08745.1 hypothetical protein [Steroidobacteraceae bacterium]HQX77697.1 hypothetical protein [Steroidobacteraceae bacterium]